MNKKKVTGLFSKEFHERVGGDPVLFSLKSSASSPRGTLECESNVTRLPESMIASSQSLRQQIASRSLSHPKHQSPKIVHFSERLPSKRPAFIRAMATKQPPFPNMPPAQMLVQGLFLPPLSPHLTSPLLFSPLPPLSLTQLHPLQ